MKRRISILGFIFFVISSLVFAIPTSADSGWDTNYDSSSSWGSSGSSWSSDSSWNSGSSWSSDYNSSGGNYKRSNESLISVLISIIIIGFVIWNLKNEINKIDAESADNTDLEDILNKYGLSLETLKNELYSIFVNIQNAWMNFDYDSLKKFCTDELYNSYKLQLSVLRVKKGKNIMDDFDLLECKITDVKEMGSQIVVTSYMKISFYDYVINSETGSVTRGNKNKKVTNNYVMTFVKSSTNIDNIVKCPNCSADVYVNASGECEYCGSVIVKDAGNFVLSKKVNEDR